MTLVKVLVSCLFLLSFFSADAQRDTVQNLSEKVTLDKVVVLSSYKNVDLLEVKSSWSASTIQTNPGINVSDLLQQSSSVYIKSYGSGGLATVSFRGTGAGRSATVWNGMPLLGSTLGLLDYSLLNAGMFESVGFSVGGDSGRYGSGSIGGNVNLENKNNIYNQDGYSIGMRSVLGSFGRFHQGVNYSFKKNKWWGSTRISFEEAKQNFTYQIREDLPVKENTNSARSQFSILQSLGYQVNDKNEIELHIWAQNNLREIPPTTVQTRSEAEVADKFSRFQAIWKHTKNDKLIWKTIAAGTYNVNDYNDPLAGVVGNNLFHQYYIKSAATYAKGNGIWNVGLSDRYTNAKTNNYQGAKVQNTLALFGDYSAVFKNWDVYISARQEMVNGELNPLSGKASLAYEVNNNFNIKATANRHYRNPALNDLYWAPGGDAALVPESGWSQDLGLEYRYKEGVKLGVNAFNSQIENWIQWGLLEESDFFSALNLPQVWSRGFEGHLALAKGNALRNISLHLSYTYNLSTYEFDLKNPSIASGDQTFYAPTHQAVGTFTFYRPKYEIQYTHRIQSGVKTFVDPLDGFDVGDLKLQYKYKELSVFFTVQNMWNATYRVIERRPMPGRNYNIGINFKIFNEFKNRI